MSQDPPREAIITADASALRKIIDDTPGDVVLCGHSYGGMVISHAIAGSHPRVVRLIYLCAYMPDNGQSAFDITGGGESNSAIVVDERGMILPDMAQAADRFYGDCDADIQRWAMGQLRAMPIPLESIPIAAWRSVPSSYVICTQDKALPVDLQRRVFAPRAQEVIEMATSHSPFFSQPGALAEILAASLNRGGPSLPQH
jgi:pimeloyl-ACP methyl ester carboxylesterase